MTYTLAIETTSPTSSVSLGTGPRVLDSVELPPLRRHTVDLMPTIDRLFKKHRATPAELERIFVSTGPGSFTGLRIGIATAKTLASVLDCRVVAVPTVEAVALNAPAPTDPSATLVVALNLKTATVYAGVFRWETAAQRWQITRPPGLATLDTLLDELPGPALLLGDPLPALAPRHAEKTAAFPAENALPRSDKVYELGHALALQNRFTPALQLLPEYAREPEAKTLWDQRHGPAQ